MSTQKKEEGGALKEDLDIKLLGTEGVLTGIQRRKGGGASHGNNRSDEHFQVVHRDELL